jgi:outer membrane lipoprotein LolB
MNKYFYHYLLISVMALLLTACATTIPPLTSQGFKQNMWSLQGRIAIKTAQQGETASVYWQQRGTQYYLRVFGPLGIGAVQLHGVPGDVSLTTNHGQTFQANTPEILIKQTLGWQLPVSNLVYWIRGEKAPHIPSQQQFDQQHHLLSLQQQGWSIVYISYNNDGLPRLLSCTRDQLTIRIVVDRWGG